MAVFFGKEITDSLVGVISQCISQQFGHSVGVRFTEMREIAQVEIRNISCIDFLERFFKHLVYFQLDVFRHVSWV